MFVDHVSPCILFTSGVLHRRRTFLVERYEGLVHPVQCCFCSRSTRGQNNNTFRRWFLFSDDLLYSVLNRLPLVSAISFIACCSKGMTASTCLIQRTRRMFNASNYDTAKFVSDNFKPSVRYGGPNLQGPAVISPARDGLSLQRGRIFPLG